MKLVKTAYDALTAIITVVLVIITIGCAYITVKEKVTGKMAFLMGYKPVYIESGSMEPAIKTGSIVIVRQYEGEEITEGEVITFRTADGYVTHRLVGIDSDAQNAGKKRFLITKGDANSINDPALLDPDDIEGLVIGV